MKTDEEKKLFQELLSERSIYSDGEKASKVDYDVLRKLWNTRVDTKVKGTALEGKVLKKLSGHLRSYHRAYDKQENMLKTLKKYGTNISKLKKRLREPTEVNMPLLSGATCNPVSLLHRSGECASALSGGYCPTCTPMVLSSLVPVEPPASMSSGKKPAKKRRPASTICKDCGHNKNSEYFKKKHKGIGRPCSIRLAKYKNNRRTEKTCVECNNRREASNRAKTFTYFHKCLLYM